MNKRKWLVLPFIIAIVAGIVAYFAIESFVMNQAEKDVRDVLLSHRGVHLYIQYTMHPEFYRARDNKEIPLGYYSPQILSSSYMVRVLHGYYNKEREIAGLQPIYYKMAADNPRNPVNRADSNEVKLLKYFREHPTIKEYHAVERINGQTCLVFAMPFLRTEQRCLVCHSTRDKAPPGVQSRYEGNGGYGDSVGNIRAVESLRVPIDQEQVAVQVASLATLAGFGAIAGLFIFSRKLRQSVLNRTLDLSSRELTSRRLLEAAKAVPIEYIPSEDLFTHVGGQIQQILGIDPSKLRTRADLEALVVQPDRDNALLQCWQEIENHRDHECEIRMIDRRSGQVKILHLAINIVTETGRKIKAVGFLHDVTEDRQREAIVKARLRITEAAFSKSLDDVSLTITNVAEELTDSEIAFLHLVDHGESAFTLTQWSTNTLKNCEPTARRMHYPAEQAGIWADSLRQRKVVIHNDYSSEANRKGLPDGHAPLLRELVVPIFNGSSIIALLGVGNKKSDYTDFDVDSIKQLLDLVAEIILRKQAEEDARRMHEHLQQAQKVEAIGRLAGGVAHDFNNMLSVIIGHAEIAMNITPDNSSIQENLREISNAADRSASITRQLLAFARRSITTPKILDLNLTVEEMLKMLKRLIGEDIELNWVPGKNIGKVKIDPSQVDQLLVNLATNARDAIKGNGRIVVETASVEFDDQYVQTHPGTLFGRYVMLAVTDSGCGIPKDMIDNIFEPFFTTKDLGKGTGLGLATVFGIVKQNGGFINVYSELNEGTVFKLYLPSVVDDVEQSTNGNREIAPSDYSGSETILIVEDEAAILELTRRILHDLGYKVLTAGGPDIAVEIAGSYREKIDLLITDVVMPGMNGRDLSDKIRELHPEAKNLFMSGYTSDVMLQRKLFDSETSFLVKPFALNDLGKRVRQLLSS